MIQAHINKAKDFFIRYDKYLSPVALLFGFTLDNITLTRIDLLLDNVILLSYLAISDKLSIHPT